MSKLTLVIERAIIESDAVENGYCSIAIKSEGDKSWIEIHGNMSEEAAEGDYPLCLDSEEEIDEFAKKLKKLLNSK